MNGWSVPQYFPQFQPFKKGKRKLIKEKKQKKISKEKGGGGKLYTQLPPTTPTF